METLGAEWTVSFLAKVYPEFYRYLIREFVMVVTKSSIVVILGLFVTFRAETFKKEPALLLTKELQDLRLDGLLTLLDVTYMGLGELITLTHYPEKMRETVKNFDLQ